MNDITLTVDGLLFIGVLLIIVILVVVITIILVGRWWNRVERDALKRDREDLDRYRQRLQRTSENQFELTATLAKREQAINDKQAELQRQAHDLAVFSRAEADMISDETIADPDKWQLKTDEGEGDDTRVIQ